MNTEKNASKERTWQQDTLRSTVRNLCKYAYMCLIFLSDSYNSNWKYQLLIRSTQILK